MISKRDELARINGPIEVHGNSAPPFTQIEIQQTTGIVCALGTDGRVYVSASSTGWIRLASTVVEQVAPLPPVGTKAPDGSALQ